jgi:hypothetical protein
VNRGKHDGVIDECILVFSRVFWINPPPYATPPSSFLDTSALPGWESVCEFQHGMGTHHCSDEVR